MIAYATGTVEKVLTGTWGVGLAMVESWADPLSGQTKTKPFTAWFETDPGVTVGEIVDVSGVVSVKVDSWTGDDGTERHTAKLSLNKAKLRAPQSVAIPAPAEDLPF